MFRDAGVPVLDADQFARDVVAVGSPGLAAVAARFGARVLMPSGELDRKALADIVFAKPDERKALNAIVHPLIGDRTRSEAARLAAENEPLACYEAALLVENGLADAFRPLVVVAATPEAQAQRMAARDGFNDAEIRGRLAAQADMEDKRRAADIVIDNDGTLDHLKDAARTALSRVCAVTKVDPSRYGVSS